MQPLKPLQCDYSNWGTWKKTIYPTTLFLENKRFSSCFTNGSIKFKVQHATVENFKTV